MDIEILNWLRESEKKGNFVQRLSEIIPNSKIDFKVGDTVTFKNGHGVKFHDLKIIAIGKDCELWKYGNCIFLDNDSYWFPVTPESLTLQK